MIIRDVLFPGVQPSEFRGTTEHLFVALHPVAIVVGFCRLNIPVVFPFPRSVVGSRKGRFESDVDRNGHGAAGPHVEPQFGIRLAAAGEDEHHGPIGASETSGERFFVGAARAGGMPGMRVQPDPAEIPRVATLIDLFIKEVRHSFVVEGNSHRSALLPHEADVLNKRKVVGFGDCEPTNFRRAVVTQEQQLGPRVRGEPERRSADRCRNLALGAKSRRLPPLPFLCMHGISHR